MVWAAIALPLFLTAGAIAAIHFNRQRERQQEAARTWRDTSLDDWRQERETVLAAERDQRQAELALRRDELSAGGAEEQEQPVRQQRLGG